MKKLTIFWILLLCSINSILWAGGGSITLAPSNTNGIKGLINFTINFRYVPTQQDVDRVTLAIRDANNIICDATDGQIVFGNVSITSGSVNENNADVWLYSTDGRSGLGSTATNGSSLSNTGQHIDLYQNAITGEVLAHELGHMAFGILDEYAECDRKIGIGFDGTTDARNNSLMQMVDLASRFLPDFSEFTVPSNHDRNRGAGGVCPTQGNPNCSDRTGVSDNLPFCQSWSPITQRYEATQQTIYNGGLSDWETLTRNFPALGLVIPNPLPNPARPTFCNSFLRINNTANASNSVMLVLDKSGSMSITDVGTSTRLEFAKAAARAFVDLQVNNNIKLGLVSFNQDATVDTRLTTLNSSNATSFKDRINALTANGATAIGKAGIKAFAELNTDRTAANPTIFLLSDGENNVAPNPNDVFPVFSSAGVRVSTIAVGNGADRRQLTDIASMTGGIYAGTNNSADLPSIYARLAAQHQGSNLVNYKQVDSLDNLGREFPPISAVTFIPVEKGVKKLTLFVSTDKPKSGDYYTAFYFKTNGREVGFLPNQIQIKRDRYYFIVTIDNPTSDNYEFWVDHEMNTSFQADNKMQLVAFVDNPNPDLYIDAFPKVSTNANQATNISTSLSYGATIFDPNVTYTGKVIRPDNTEIPLSFMRDAGLNMVSSKFSNYNYKGTYKVFVEANVPNNAQFMKGESIFTGPVTPNILVEKFKRTGYAEFYYNHLSLPCDNCQPQNDCDKDGIITQIEDRSGDIDQDGLNNRCDEDSDGDDVPDKTEGTADSDNDGVPNYLDPNFTILKPCDGTKYWFSSYVLTLPSCDNPINGTLEVKAQGGKNYSFSWLHDNTITSPRITNLVPSIYVVTAIVDNTCTISKAIVVECAKTTSITETQANSDYKVYPNPAQNLLTIECQNDEIISVEVFNSVGQFIKKVNTGKTTSMTLDISSLQTGFYVLKLKTGKGEVFKKITILR